MVMNIFGTGDPLMIRVACIVVLLGSARGCDLNRTIPCMKKCCPLDTVFEPPNCVPAQGFVYHPHFHDGYAGTVQFDFWQPTCRNGRSLLTPDIDVFEVYSNGTVWAPEYEPTRLLNSNEFCVDEMPVENTSMQVVFVCFKPGPNSHSASDKLAYYFLMVVLSFLIYIALCFLLKEELVSGHRRSLAFLLISLSTVYILSVVTHFFGDLPSNTYVWTTVLRILRDTANLTIAVFICDVNMGVFLEIYRNRKTTRRKLCSFYPSVEWDKWSVISLVIFLCVVTGLSSYFLFHFGYHHVPTFGSWFTVVGLCIAFFILIATLIFSSMDNSIATCIKDHRIVKMVLLFCFISAGCLVELFDVRSLPHTSTGGVNIFYSIQGIFVLLILHAFDLEAFNIIWRRKRHDQENVPCLRELIA